jgi:hypothetical protein
MRVTITYAKPPEDVPRGCVLHPIFYSSQLSAYDGLELKITGDIETVANWIDEHIFAAQCAMAGAEYHQGSATEAIVKALKENDYYDTDYGLLEIKRHD